MFRATFSLALVAFLFLGCSAEFGGDRGKEAGDKEDSKDTKAAELVVPVEAQLPERGDISSYFESSTRVEAERRVQVASKGSGRCTELLVDEGDAVAQGQILAELEKAEAQASYDQSSVQVKQNKTAYDLAKRQFDEGLGTRIDMDNAQYAYEQSLATLESQKLMIDNLTVRAPISGVITTRNIQLGMLVSNGDAVFDIMDPESFILTIAPPEKELTRLEIGQEAEITIDALPGKTFDARIRRINPSVDPLTGTIKVVLDFVDESAGKLRESAFARVKLVMSTRNNVILVPKEAILSENGKQYLFTLAETDGETFSFGSDDDSEGDDNDSVLAPEVEASVVNENPDALPAATDEVPVYIANRVEIMTGLEDGSRVQVFSGLDADTLLVTNGQHSLKDGTKVRVTNIQNELSRLEGLSAEDLLEAAKKKRAGEDDGKSDELDGGVSVEVDF